MVKKTAGCWREEGFHLRYSFAPSRPGNEKGMQDWQDVGPPPFCSSPSDDPPRLSTPGVEDF
ncbi:carotene isomerase [Anopheles sinensis]|uniref:Carotene isomerase n=1 Tax=Anopheles sinensis TaxID=74873 RepID=A0A084WH88_ANOSI|nr:carotene isomerase [Anopheles sinensis]